MKPLNKKKIIIIAAAVLVIAGAAGAYFFFFRGGGDGEGEPLAEEKVEEPVEAPREYTVGDDSVMALPIMTDKVLVYKEEPEIEEPKEEDKDKDDKDKDDKDGEDDDDDGEDKASGSDDSSSGEDSAGGSGEEARPGVQMTADALIYRYEGLASSAQTVAAYATLLTLDEAGFSFVDDNLYKTETPDLAAEEGSIRLAQKAVAEGKVMSVQLSWSPGMCTVVMDTPEGSVRTPRSETAPMASASMSLTEAVDYVYSLPPSAIGLEGESMEEYKIYAVDGIVMVDDNPCLHLNICSTDDSTSSNHVEGSYFLSSDQQHIYRLNVDTGKVEELSPV